MPALASISLEFFAPADYGWWAAVAAVVGIALLAYAFSLFREKNPAFSAQAALRKTPSFKPLLAAATLGSLSLLFALTLLFSPSFRSASLASLWLFIAGSGAVWLFYQRVYRYLGTRRISTLFSLRILAILSLLLLLFQPALGFIKMPENRSQLAIVIDASESMSIADQENAPTRYRQSIIAAQEIAARLGDRYTVQCFAYDTAHNQPLGSVEDYNTISPKGQVTDLLVASNLGASAGATQVVLFSDGIHNGPQALETNLGSIPVPIHTVRVGSDQLEPSTIKDIAVVGVDGPQTTTVNNLVTLTASIKSTAMSDRTISVFLEQPLLGGETGGGDAKSAKQLDEQRLVLHSGPTPQTVQLKFTPDHVGRRVVRVRVPVDPAQRSDVHNQLDFPLLVTDPKLALLYVEGRVRPEVGPLRRAFEEDPNINAVSLVQTRPGRFEIRGLKQGDDLAGIPTTLAQWKRFKIIIFGDLDASFLSPQQQSDLQNVVKQGAGMLMIGGQNTFNPGHWDRTTLAEMLPVDLSPVQPSQIGEPFVPQLTAVGQQQSIFKGIASYFGGPDGAPPKQQLPPLKGCVALAAAKPGANILAVHPTAKINGQPAIVLAVEQYGKGRTAAFSADTTYKWNLYLRGLGKDSPFNRFWGQTVRWLAGQEDLQKKNGPSVTAMIPKERYDANEPVTLRAAVTDKDGQSTNFANATATLKMPDGKTTSMPLAAVADTIGTYEAKYTPPLAGKYDVTFTAAKDNNPLGQDTSNFSVTQAAGEMDVLAARPADLQKIATATGGTYTDFASVQTLIDHLADSLPKSAAVQKSSFPTYTPASFRTAFLAFVVFLTLEWLLRRKWQLQ